MTKLDRLLAELCPDGVERVELGSVCLRSNNIKWSDQDSDFQYIDLTSVDRAGHYIVETTTIDASNAPSRAQQVIRTGDVIFATTRPTLQRFCSIPEEFDGQICSTGFCVLRPMTDRVISRYIYHIISTSDFQAYVESTQKGASYPAITNGEVKAFIIPLPPLPVQQEIVRILDNFTELTAELTAELPAELTAELAARKKQYEYYRNELLTFGDDVPMVTLGEVGRVAMCKRIMKAETSSEGEVPFYKIGTFGKDPDAYISNKTYERYKDLYSYPKKGDVLISAAGTIGRTVIFDGKPAYYQDSNIVWLEHDESKALNKYLFHCYQRSPWHVSSGGTILRLYNDNIVKAKIPLPPLTEQARIVAILDKFDALTTDITTGLPAEIEARRKQYEYYRDKLMQFTIHNA